MSQPFYSYPEALDHISLGSRVTQGAGATVYTIERIQVRNCDSTVCVSMRSEKTRQTAHKIASLRVVK